MSTDNLSGEQVMQCLTLVMDECWAELEYERPSFDVCLELIYRFTGDKCVYQCHFR